MKNVADGTKINFLGGNNESRIGGNSFIVEHSEEGKDVTRVMVDLGALFPPEWTELDAIIPDVREYLDFKEEKAQKPINAMFISHCHEDHIGGLVHLARAGYEFPDIYGSRYTVELIRTAMKESKVPEEFQPHLIKVDEGETIDVASNVKMSPFNVSHSTMGAMGVHILTTNKNRVCAGILNPGDYRLGESMVGPGFNEEKFAQFLKDKPVTHVLLDSTSTDNSDDYLVDFQTAVANTKEQIAKHPNFQVVSAVISRSIQNLAIDLQTAKDLGRKVFIDGYWAKLAFMAVQKSGNRDYDDVVFASEDLKNANAQDFLQKFPPEQRYIIPSGAFAESKKGKKSGLYKMSEQQKVVSSENKKSKNSNAIKGKGDTGHPDFTIDSKTLILARQRCIEDINGKQVRAMYNRLAALGATIIENKSSNNTGKFETSLMQRTGHAVRSETKKFIEMIVKARKNLSKVAFIPVHGDHHQLANTAKVVLEAGGEPSICYNTDEIKVWAGGTKKLDTKPIEEQTFIAVQEESITMGRGICDYVYTIVDKDFAKKDDLLRVSGNEKSLVEREEYSRNDLEKAHYDEENYHVPSSREISAKFERFSRKSKKKSRSEVIKAGRAAAGYSKHSKRGRE